MRENMGGGLPIAGFYEMKQDIFETAQKLKLQTRNLEQAGYTRRDP